MDTEIVMNHVFFCAQEFVVVLEPEFKPHQKTLEADIVAMNILMNMVHMQVNMLITSEEQREIAEASNEEIKLSLIGSLGKDSDIDLGVNITVNIPKNLLRIVQLTVQALMACYTSFFTGRRSILKRTIAKTSEESASDRDYKNMILTHVSLN